MHAPHRDVWLTGSLECNKTIIDVISSSCAFFCLDECKGMLWKRSIAFFITWKPPPPCCAFLLIIFTGPESGLLFVHMSEFIMLEYALIVIHKSSSFNQPKHDSLHLSWQCRLMCFIDKNIEDGE